MFLSVDGFETPPVFSSLILIVYLMILSFERTAKKSSRIQDHSTFLVLGLSGKAQQIMFRGKSHKQNILSNWSFMVSLILEDLSWYFKLKMVIVDHAVFLN